MLQPLWRRFDERIEGISIFYSKIEALFYATYLNEQFRENWDVYPLEDFNIVEMIQHNKKHKNRDNYYLLLNAGFWVNKKNELLYSKYHIAQVTIPVEFNITFAIDCVVL